MEWNEVVSMIHSTYKIADEQPDLIRLDFSLANGRSQKILINHQTLSSGEEWIKFYSPVGVVPPSLLRKALQVADEYLSGGLIAFDDGMVWARNCSLLSTFSAHAFERLMNITMNMADEIEDRVLGEDMN